MKRFFGLLILLIFLLSSTNLLAARKVITVGYIHQALGTYMNQDYFYGHNACGPTSAVMIVKHHWLQPIAPGTYPGYYVYSEYPDFTDKSGEDYDSKSAMDMNASLQHIHSVYGAHGYIVVQSGSNWLAHPDSIIRYLRNHGLTTPDDFISTDIFQTVKDNIDAGLPLIGHVNLAFGEDTYGHYLVIVGYDETGNKIVVNDPYGDYNNTWDGTTTGIEVDYNVSLCDKVLPAYPVGVYAGYSGWHTTGTSQAFFDCYDSHVDTIGQPFKNGEDGSVYVHFWENSNYPGDGVWIQDFQGDMDDTHYGTDAQSAIILNTTTTTGYLIKEGFWRWYKENHGYKNMGEPLGEEYSITGGARQNFEEGYLVYSDQTGKVTPYDGVGSPIPQFRVTICTNPQGAEIYSGGQEPDTALVTKALYEGYTYDMVAKMSGYADTEFDFTVGTSDTTLPTVSMLPSGSNDPIYITNPTSGEYPVGTTMTIQYAYTISSNVKIELSRNGGSTWEELFWSSICDGEQEWTVSGTTFNLCLIRITSLANSSDCDTSGVFSIVQASNTQTIEAETMNAGVDVTGGKKLQRAAGANDWYLTKSNLYTSSGHIQAEVVAKGDSIPGGTFHTKLQGYEASALTVTSTDFQSYYFDHYNLVSITDYVELILDSNPAIVVDKIILRYIPPPQVPTLSVVADTLDFGLSYNQLSTIVANDSNGTLHWVPSWTADWISSTNPDSGDLGEDQSTSMTVNIDRSELSQINNSTTLTVNSNGGSHNIVVLATLDTSGAENVVFYSAAGDGHIYMKETGGSWDVIHDATSSEDVDETYVRDEDAEQTDFYNDRAGQNPPYEYEISRAFFPFNTANIPDNAQILSANLIVSIKHQTHNQTASLGVVQASQDSTSILDDTDFDNCGSVDNPIEGSERIEYTSVESNFVRRTFALDSTGLSWISKTGYTNLGIRGSLDLDDQAPTAPNRWAFRYSEYSGVADDPVLEVRYIVNSSSSLNLNVDSLDFGYSQDSLTFSITCTGSWSDSVSHSWLNCNLSSGSGDTTVIVTVNRDSLSAGTYNGSVTVNGPESTEIVYITVSKQAPQTVSFYSEAGDGHFYTKLVNDSWSVVRNATSSSDVDEMVIRDTQSEVAEYYSDRTGQSSYEYELSRGYYAFNTASLPDSAVITGATLTVSTMHQTHSVTISLCLVEGSQAGVSSLVDTDFDNRSSVELANRIEFTQAEANFSRRTFTLNSNGLNAISKTGYTKLAIISSQDQDNQAPTSNSRWTFRYSEYTGTSEDPVLEITYTVPMAKPVAEGEKDKEEAVLIPKQFKLCQNYPNPFNPETVIKYELPKDVHVYISVYNILGQQVAVLEDSYHEAGYYQVTWKSDNLSSGLYFYQINAGKYMEIKKMLLIK